MLCVCVRVSVSAVVEGYDVVKKIEDCGTNSGKPKEGVCVCACVCVCVCARADGMDPPSDVLLYVDFFFLLCFLCYPRICV